MGLAGFEPTLSVLPKHGDYQVADNPEMLAVGFEPTLPYGTDISTIS